MPIANYTIGPPTRPSIQHDNGHLSISATDSRFDPSKYRNPTAADYKLRAKWLAKLEGGEAVQGIPLFPHNDLPDALPAYRHFLSGSGKDRTFSYERYVASDDSGKKSLASAILDAQQGAAFIYTTAYNGQSSVHFQMTGTAISAGNHKTKFYSMFPYPATENWQKAIGAHVLWISADVDVVVQNNISQYSMIMTLHAEDRFNFNPGAQDIVTGIPDEENGIFEVTGLAKQYMNYGTLQRSVTWSGAISDQTSSKRSDSGRDRKPSDNIRVRNRL